MMDPRTSQDSPPAEQATVRQAYESPRLTEFGSVKELTRSGSGGSGEVRSSRKR